MKKFILIILIILVLGIYCFKYIPVSYYEEVISDVYYYKDFDDNVIPVPQGFIVDEKNNLVKEGLVIIDNTNNITRGNEFVWVPCEEFKRIDWSNDSLNFKNYNLNFVDEKEYQNIVDSVNKYKGFYVGRYEASKSESYIDNVQVATSLPNKKPWNEINYSTNMLDKYGISYGALKVAKYTYKNMSNVKSTILYSEHFDSIISWYIDSGVLDKNEINKSDLNDNTINLTGQNELLNIYDLFGNVEEFTTESYLGSYHIVRGGAYDNQSIQREHIDAYTISFSVGFRLVLII